MFRWVYAAVVELAYTYASGAYGRKAVRVQVPPAAPLTKNYPCDIITSQVKNLAEIKAKPVNKWQLKITFLIVIC